MAFVVLSGAPDSLQLVDLGGKLESDVNAIDDAVARYREAIGAVGRDFLQPAAPSDAQRLEAMSGIGRKARELVFDPLRPTLNGLRRLFLAPDASLTFLPFEALPFDDGGFVLDDCTVSYLTTGRDLTGFGPRQGEPSAAVVAADPDFDLAADADAPASMAGRRSSDLDRGHTLQRLNGARAEGSRSPTCSG